MTNGDFRTGIQVCSPSFQELSCSHAFSCFSGSYNVIRVTAPCLSCLPHEPGSQSRAPGWDVLPPCRFLLAQSYLETKRSLGHLGISVRNSMSRANQWPQSPQKKPQCLFLCLGLLPTPVPSFHPSPLSLVKYPSATFSTFLPPFVYQDNHLSWSIDHIWRNIMN